MDKLFSDFGINWTSLIFYSINFFLLLYLLNRFLFKPVNKMIEERKKMSEETADNLEKSRKDLTNLELTIKENLKEANAKTQEIIDGAKKSASDIVDKSADDAKQKADKILENTQKEINERQNAMEQEVKTHVLGQVKKLFEVLVKSSPDKTQEKLLNDSLDGLKNK